MVKRCQWGLCNSDSRYPDRLEGGVSFIPFPKPRRNLEKCKRWIKACGRPQEQLSVNIIDGNHHMFVCTKHFPEGAPTEKYPDPIPVDCKYSCYTPARPPPKQRPLSEPSKKCRKRLSMIACSKENQGICIDKSHQDAEQQTDDSPSVSPLDLLALAAESRALKEKLAEQILVNEQLKRENIELFKANKGQNTNQIIFSVETVRKSHVKNNFKYHTGFTYEQFMNIFTFLVPNKNEAPLSIPKIRCILPLEDQLLLTLLKLRLNFEFAHLANLFNMSQQNVGRIFRAWINYMFYRFGSVPIWPDREVLYQKMPAKFKQDFPTTFVILDGTEIKVERPSALRSQSQCYSDYKSATTMKGLVGIDPRGSFIFISMLFSGSISDKEITRQSGLLTLLQQLLDCGRLKPGDGVMADKGFLIREEIEQLGLKLFLPPFAPGGGQMSASDVAITKKIATHRVHVERAISRAKKFKIVAERMDLCLFACVNQIWFCCCFLTGFMPLLIQD